MLPIPQNVTTFYNHSSIEVQIIGKNNVALRKEAIPLISTVTIETEVISSLNSQVQFRAHSNLEGCVCLIGQDGAAVRMAN